MIHFSKQKKRVIFGLSFGGLCLIFFLSLSFTASVWAAPAVVQKSGASQKTAVSKPVSKITVKAKATPKSKLKVIPKLPPSSTPTPKPAPTPKPSAPAPAPSQTSFPFSRSTDSGRTFTFPLVPVPIAPVPTSTTSSSGPAHTISTTPCPFTPTTTTLTTPIVPLPTSTLTPPPTVSQCPCKRSGPYTSVDVLILAGQGNTIVDDARSVVGADLPTGANTAAAILGATSGVNPPVVVPTQGTPKEGQNFNDFIRQNTASFEVALLRMVAKIKCDCNLHPLILLMINDHASINGTTGLSYQDIWRLIIKYVPCCVHVEIVHAGCHSQAIIDDQEIGFGVQSLGSEVLDPLKAEYRQNHPELPADEGIPEGDFKQLKGKVRDQLPAEAPSVSVTYAAAVCEENLNLLDGGFFVGWANGFANSVKGNGGKIDDRTLGAAFNGGDSAKGSNSQHPGRSTVDLTGAINKEFSQ